MIDANLLRRNYKTRSIHTNILKTRSAKPFQHFFLHHFLGFRKRNQQIADFKLVLLHFLHFSVFSVLQLASFPQFLIRKRQNHRDSLLSLNLQLHTLPIRQQIHMNPLHTHELLHNHRLQHLGGLHRLDNAQRIARKMHLMQHFSVRNQRFQHTAVHTGRQHDDLITFRLREKRRGVHNPHQRVGENDKWIVSNASRKRRKDEIFAVFVETEKRRNTSNSTIEEPGERYSRCLSSSFKQSEL